MTEEIRERTVGHKTGDVIAMIRYGKVLSYDKDRTQESLFVKAIDSDQEMIIKGADLVSTVKSASLFETTEKVSATRIAELVSTAFNLPISVHFVKKDGKERTLVGKLKSVETVMGRSYFDDLVTLDGRPRLVDHRTIKWAVIDNVRYVTK